MNAFNKYFRLLNKFFYNRSFTFPILLLITLYPFLGNANEAQTNKKITFATSFAENTFYFQAYQAIYLEAFHRMGYSFELVVYPSKRLAKAVDSGILDGDVSRIKQMQKDNMYPNLVRVNEPIMEMHISMFGYQNPLNIKKWQDFKNQKISVAYPRGYRIVELNLPQWLDKQYISEVSNSIQGCRMLVGKRFDLLIDVKRTVEYILSNREFQGHQVEHLGILQTIVLYPYFNKKNQDLVPHLANALKAMKEDGSYSRLINSFTNGG